MKCPDYQKLLPSLIAGDLAAPRSLATRQHAADCTVCRGRLAELARTVELVRSLGQQLSVPSDFQAQLHERLLLEPPPKISLVTRLAWMLEPLGLDSGRRLWACAAVGAVLVLLSVGTRLHFQKPQTTVFVPEEHLAASFRIPTQRIVVVQLDFVADALVEDVEFQVSLPRELEFVDGGQPVRDKQIFWRGSLSAGSNPIPVAVRGLQPGRFRLQALARGKQVTVTHEVLLEVVKS